MLLFTFPIVKLIDYGARRSELEASTNPFAMVALAHLTSHETRADMAWRGEAKLALTRRLYERGFSRQEVLDLYRFIDWLLQLPEALEAHIWQEIVKYEEAHHMVYVTTAERIGRREGLAQALRQGLLTGLELKFGHDGLQLIPELQQIEDTAIRQAIGETLKPASSIDEVRQIYVLAGAE